MASSILLPFFPHISPYMPASAPSIFSFYEALGSQGCFGFSKLEGYNDAFETVERVVYAVDYGDVVLATAPGKVIASIVALIGVAFIALPTGILGAGFIEEFEKIRNPSQTSKKQSSLSFSVADEIRKFVSLHDEGHITDEEFNAQKALLLGNSK